MLSWDQAIFQIIQIFLIDTRALIIHWVQAYIQFKIRESVIVEIDYSSRTERVALFWSYRNKADICINRFNLHKRENVLWFAIDNCADFSAEKQKDTRGTVQH